MKVLNPQEAYILSIIAILVYNDHDRTAKKAAEKLDGFALDLANKIIQKDMNDANSKSYLEYAEKYNKEQKMRKSRGEI